MANYLKIDDFDIANGVGIGVSIFFAGCDMNPKCKGCFNKEAWDFNVGKPFTQEVRWEVLDLMDNPNISHLSILGGEPLAKNNITSVSILCHKAKVAFPDKKVWVWTHYTWEELMKDDLNFYLLKDIDILVDGEFIEEQKDLTLPFRGSKNQRLIDVQKSLEENKTVLYDLKL